MSKNLFFFGLFISILVLACKKDEPKPPTTGIYRGVFNRIYNNEDTTRTGIVFISLKDDKDSTFYVAGDTSSFAPYNNGGYYSILSYNKIYFKRTSSFYGEIEDENFFLDTIYDFVFTDSTFEFEYEVGFNKYRYNLERF